MTPLGAIPDITGLTADSRAVKPGFLFAALPGVKTDGREFVADAVRAGASAVLVPADSDYDPGVPVVKSPEPRRALALMAAAFYGRQPETVVAVTGTSGKSSTVEFTRQIWQALGYKAAAIGTLGVTAGELSRYGTLTTPDPVQLHADLAMLAMHGVTHAALEASSHGLDQFRLDGVKINAAAFTNLSRDHLDYHANMGTYFAAKLRLFQDLVHDDGTAVLNADAPEFGTLKAVATTRKLRIISYGKGGADLQLIGQMLLPDGQTLTLLTAGNTYRITVNLIGAFQGLNVLAALGLVLAGGADVQATLAILPQLQGVAGRAQHVATLPNGATVFVDYAHKPGALETILTAIRPHVTNKLAVVFGCGGDRDRGKRPLMGEIAGRLADRVYVTDDNPRSEDPAAIRREVMAGCPDATEIGDRAEAIATAIRALQANDVLVIAGKGHEQGQIVGSTVIPFDDVVEAQRAVAALA